jgi:hypothetical protein
VEFFPVKHGIRGNELERILKYKFGSMPKFALPDCTLEKLQNADLKNMIEARMKSRPRAPTEGIEFTALVSDGNFDGFYEVTTQVLMLIARLIIVLAYFYL